MKDILKTIVETLGYKFYYMRASEANMQLDGDLQPVVILHEVRAGTFLKEANSWWFEAVYVIEVLTQIEIIEDTSENNDVRMETCKQICFDLLDELAEVRELETDIDTVAFEKVNEDKYDAGCIGYQMTLTVKVDGKVRC